MQKQVSERVLRCLSLGTYCAVHSNQSVRFVARYPKNVKGEWAMLRPSSATYMDNKDNMVNRVFFVLFPNRMCFT
jgi:hypothetical protein